jgi:nitrogen regulatory protein P-II 2
MKYIIAIIQPDRLNEVVDELDKHDVHLMTVTQVMGHGRQKGEAEVYRGHKEAGRFLRKVKLEIGVNDEFVDKAIAAITSGAKIEGGTIGDGKIFVFEMQDCIRIRTDERGDAAIG